MYRLYSYTVILSLGLLGLCSFKSGDPEFVLNPLIYNTTMDNFFRPEGRGMVFPDGLGVTEPDTLTRPRVLMLDYSAYGSAYNEKIRGIIEKYLPKAYVSDFTEGTADDLTHSLYGCGVVVIAYPSSASPGVLKTYNKVLSQFVQQGGSVIFTGTHEFEVLQQFGLFDLDFGYFSKDHVVHGLHMEHPLFDGVSNDFMLANFSYPLDISDSGFSTLAEVGGYPVIGYKTQGLGKIIYLGVEYYYDEGPSSKILINALTWSGKHAQPETTTPGANIAFGETAKLGVMKRSEETLYTGTGEKAEPIDLKVYPNPYWNKATLDIELTKTSALMVEMTDEAGRNIAVILPKRTLGPGLCRFELPNIAPGIYFLQVQIGDKSYVRKVVKASEN